MLGLFYGCLVSFGFLLFFSFLFFVSRAFLFLSFFLCEPNLEPAMDVTLTIRSARPQDVQQLLNLRRPRRDRSPLRRQRPHIQILSNEQQDALQALDIRSEQESPSASHSVSRPHLEPLPRRRHEQADEGTRAKHKARPYSAFPRVRRAPTASAASSSNRRPESANRDQAPGVGDIDRQSNLGVWSSPTRRSRRPDRQGRPRPAPSPSPSPSPSPPPQRRPRSRSRRRGPSLEQRMQDEANQQRRQRQMPSTLVDTEVSVPHNLSQ